MCGRYQFDFSDREQFRSRFQIEGDYPYGEIKTRFNVSPGQLMPTITSHSPNKVEMMLWGFVPAWEKSDKPKGLINLRDDTVTQKPWALKYLESQRCLIPASGFYEWKKTTEGKLPYYIKPKTDNYFAFAGLYSIWKHPKTGEEKKTYAIITTSPNGFMQSIHNRMPVILDPNREADWLNPDNVEAKKLGDLLNPYKGDMTGYPVSTRVNSPANDDLQVKEPLQSNHP